MSTHGGAESGRPDPDETKFMEVHDNPRLTYGGGAWVRRQADKPAGHRCPLPGDGAQGDLWRCGCRRLWQLGQACDWCDRYGDSSHAGTHAVGVKWRPARLGQRIRYWRSA